MLDTKGVEEYWKIQTERGENPCHYHNVWQDRYAFVTRIKAFQKSDFEKVKNIVDLGCGIGEYTSELAKLTTAHFDAYDFPFNIAVAKTKYPDHPSITFHPHTLPDDSILSKVKDADLVYTTTVYVHFSDEARFAFYDYIKYMRSGSRVLLLEYLPDEIPLFQRDLPYKNLETASEIVKKFKISGFRCHEVRHINFIDSFLFFHFGKNVFTYHATRILEQILRFCGYTKSKYKLLVFVKN